MPVIREEIVVRVPIAACFDGARDIGLHSRTVWPHTRERAVEGVTDGLIEADETVTFEARHFGVRQRLTAVVTGFDRPRRFEDIMVHGAFARMRHLHEFEAVREGTLMIDVLDFRSPYGLAGRLFDAVVLGRYMRAFLRYRQRTLKRLLEETYRLEERT